MTLMRVAVAVPVIAALTVGAWYAWLGRDTTDEAWQVAGCVVTLAVIAFCAGIASPVWIVAPVMTLSFTAAWSAGAARSDDSGLWAVGAILVLLGTAAGSTLLAFVARRVTRRSGAATRGWSRPHTPAG